MAIDQQETTRVVMEAEDRFEAQRLMEDRLTRVRVCEEAIGSMPKGLTKGSASCRWKQTWVRSDGNEVNERVKTDPAAMRIQEESARM